LKLRLSPDAGHASSATDYGEQQESLDLRIFSYHQTPEASLGPSKYFSKAVHQLSLPDKKSCPVPRRKSHHQARDFVALKRDESENFSLGFSTQQGVHHITVTSKPGRKRSQAETGDIELGIPARLKRTLSSVPFRPPIKKLM